MPDCTRRDAYVTPRSARIFGDNEDEVYGCRNCVPIAALIDGRASRSDS